MLKIVYHKVEFGHWSCLLHQIMGIAIFQNSPMWRRQKPEKGCIHSRIIPSRYVTQSVSYIVSALISCNFFIKDYVNRKITWYIFIFWYLQNHYDLGHTKLISWFSGLPACGNSSLHCRFYCKNSKKKN